MRFSQASRCAILLAVALWCEGKGIGAQTQTTAPPCKFAGSGDSWNDGSEPFAAALPGKLVPGVLQLSLQEAIDRGLRQNLGVLLSNADIQTARGQRWEQLSALLPHAELSPYVAASEINLAELGFGSIGALESATSVGPFSYF